MKINSDINDLINDDEMTYSLEAEIMESGITQDRNFERNVAKGLREQEKEIKDLAVATKQEVQDLAATTKQDIIELKADVKAQISRMEIKIIKWQIGGIVLIIAAIKFL